MKGKFMRGCLKKWREMSRNQIRGAQKCSRWTLLLWSSMFQEKGSTPRDVPKGHIVVYVGENLKRFVVSITLLNHPLFQALLEQARDEYDFITDSKLCIPCDEHIFLSVVRSSRLQLDP